MRCYTQEKEDCKREERRECEVVGESQRRGRMRKGREESSKRWEEEEREVQSKRYQGRTRAKDSSEGTNRDGNPKTKESKSGSELEGKKGRENKGLKNKKP